MKLYRRQGAPEPLVPKKSVNEVRHILIRRTIRHLGQHIHDYQAVSLLCPHSRTGHNR